MSRRAQGHGYGELLIGDALARVAAAADTIGCSGVVVDAKDGRAEAFYGRYGFTTLETSKYPRRMFLPMSTIEAAQRRRAARSKA